MIFRTVAATPEFSGSVRHYGVPQQNRFPLQPPRPPKILTLVVPVRDLVKL